MSERAKERREAGLVGDAGLRSRKCEEKERERETKQGREMQREEEKRAKSTAARARRSPPVCCLYRNRSRLSCLGEGARPQPGRNAMPAADGRYGVHRIVCIIQYIIADYYYERDHNNNNNNNNNIIIIIIIITRGRLLAAPGEGRGALLG
ncbi:predicted protein [Coccidioides posadasii str. Silveira]|uniref:Predicted protein n=1 Tax=Coccidioides posadasii (strain RMSCC 757 / Silveira) TaxID=443226 RepID=E9D3A0_COCPS|nr:predicted protein [Coccidioides posadasii str. Silveira]